MAQSRMPGTDTVTDGRMNGQVLGSAHSVDLSVSDIEEPRGPLLHGASQLAVLAAADGLELADLPTKYL